MFKLTISIPVLMPGATFDQHNRDHNVAFVYVILTFTSHHGVRPGAHAPLVV
jgi:hypothetical protein